MLHALGSAALTAGETKVKAGTCCNELIVYRGEGPVNKLRCRAAVVRTHVCRENSSLGPGRRTWVGWQAVSKAEDRALKESQGTWVVLETAPQTRGQKEEAHGEELQRGFGVPRQLLPEGREQSIALL